jgi:hypothetical protein
MKYSEIVALKVVTLRLMRKMLPALLDRRLAQGIC